MINLEKISGALLFLFGLIIFLKSLDYPLGSLRLPGAGVFPLLASALLMALSISIIISSHMKRHERSIPQTTFFPAKETPARIMYGFVSLLAFRYLLPLIGFAPSTFLFIFFLGRFLAHYNLRVNFVFSVLTAFVSYYLFQVWLKIPLPRGVFGI
jgi:putative tricarboxylic transport membrane protein